jgi:hypothetical protein
MLHTPHRDAAEASELHRRFWVGSIAELIQGSLASKLADPFFTQSVLITVVAIIQ